MVPGDRSTRHVKQDTNCNQPIRRALQIAWKHMPPEEKDALKAWADRMCDVDFDDQDALVEAVGAVLDCALDENPEFQALLAARMEELRRNPESGTRLGPIEAGPNLLD